MHQKLCELVEELKYQRRFPPERLGLQHNYMNGIGQLRQQIERILDDLIIAVISTPREYGLNSEREIISDINKVQDELFKIGRGCIARELNDPRDHQMQITLMSMLDKNYNTLFDHLVRKIRQAEIDKRTGLPLISSAIKEPTTVGELKSVHPIETVTSLLTRLQAKQPPPIIVLLLHGIRTDAFWHQEFRDVIDGPHDEVNIIVESRKYGNMPLLEFLLPILRKRKLRWLRETLEELKARYQGAEINVVAHSFGTYLIAEVLKRNPGLRLNRIILCGSILKRDFAWQTLLQNNWVTSVINDCGMHDIWPTLSRLFVVGTGDSGVFGFNASGNGVSNRFFDYYAHSSFFTRTHIETYWLPFIVKGQVVSGPSPIPKPALLNRLLVSIPWISRGVLFLLFIALIVIPALNMLSIRTGANYQSEERRTAEEHIFLGLRYPYEFKGGYGGARNDRQGQFRPITNEPIRLDFVSGKQEIFRFGVQNANPGLPVENTRIHIIFNDAELKVKGDPPWQIQVVNHDMSFNLGTVNSGEFINAQNLYVTFPRPGAYNLVGVIVGKGISPLMIHFQVILE